MFQIFQDVSYPEFFGETNFEVITDTALLQLLLAKILTFFGRHCLN